MLKRLIYLALIFPFAATAQIKEPYALFNAEGKQVSYASMAERIAKADVVFFGELHNNTLAHWLELQILKELHAGKKKLAVGMEMFERDDQIVLDEYLSGQIDEKNFLKEVKLWDNYNTDYKPMVEYAKKAAIPVIATNVPRRYANLVYRKGLTALDSISQEAKQWIAPLPLVVDYTLPGYKAMMEGMGQHGGGSGQNLVASQALKDATMAHFTVTNLPQGGIFYHMNGSYHSQNYEGILAYLKKYKPGLNVITLHVVEQSSISALDKSNLNKADFIFCIVEDIAKSY